MITNCEPCRSCSRRLNLFARRARKREIDARSLKIDNSAERATVKGARKKIRRHVLPRGISPNDSEPDREIWITPYSTREAYDGDLAILPHDHDHDHARTPNRPLRPPTSSPPLLYPFCTLHPEFRLLFPRAQTHVRALG